MGWFESVLGGVGWKGFRWVWKDYAFKGFGEVDGNSSGERDEGSVKGMIDVKGLDEFLG